MSAEEFVAEVLVARLGVGAVVVGWDFHFGKGRSGSPATLAEAGTAARLRRRDRRQGRRRRRETAVVSSTRHPPGARAGRCRRRGAGSRPQLCGFRPGDSGPASWAHAWRARRRISRSSRPTGSPTASMRSWRESTGAPFRRSPASASARRSTTAPPLLEVHLLDFDGDLYGREMEVEFIERIRDERKFDSLTRWWPKWSGTRSGRAAILAGQRRRIWRFAAKSSNSHAADANEPEFGLDRHDRRARRRPRLFAHPLSAEDRFPHARRSAAEGAGDFGALGARESLRRAARERQGPPQIRAARRAALRQRQHPHRPRAQQDPEGHGGPLAADGGQGFQLRARLGLPRPADRMEGRGGVLPQARARRSPTSRIPRRSSRSARNAAPMPSIGSPCSARSSSGSAWSATGTIPIRR